MIITLACCSYAQSTFMKTFRGTGTAQANLNELSSGNLLVGMARQSGTSLMDAEGNIIQSHNYAIDTLLAIQSVKKWLDNELFLVGGYYKDTCTAGTLGLITKTYPVIGKLDSLGNLTELRHYVLNSNMCSNVAGDLIIINNKNIVIWGRDAMFFALRADSSGEVVWAKRFIEQGGFQFIKELPGGDLLAGINMDTAGAVVARMDADGNFLWCKSYIRPLGRVHDAIIESDSSFVITGFTEYSDQHMFLPFPPDFHPKLFMMKLDGQGEVQWCKGYDSAPNYWHTPRPSRIVKTLDGQYAILGTLGYPGYNRFLRPFLMKADQNGDTIWTRSVGADGYEYQSQNLLAYSDGSFLFNGRIWGGLPEGQANFAFLFKADSLGHLPCDELQHPITISNLFPTDSSFTLTSVDGATAYPAYVQDTTYDAIQVYNACTHTGVPNLYNLGRNKPRIRPNPNTGRFTVDFPDPLMADSFYSVYDAMGRLLFQRPLHSGQQSEEIDLSRFGRGTYVVRITGKDGVSNERVVVQ
ncbi:MAG TPA: T9SS type A sorting domain-containing protein [Flavobacteriales bacterium]|mgnify:CR=1 FL=1|nr:T9SS type A sorting domain-containing protein [Flavobacteriales bacterium]